MDIAALKAAAEAIRDGAGQYLGKDYAEHRRAFSELTEVTAILSLIERVEALEEALEPSGDTKAAYMGEFYLSVTRTDEAGDEYREDICVSWTTIKEIMAAIRARALSPTKHTGR